MYESPVHLYMTDVQTQLIKKQEEQILKAVQSVAVGVDHDELFRALKYDREQYEKGYQDAVREKNLVEVVRCKDCKHRVVGWSNGEYQCGNPYYGMASGVDLRDEDFCSYGERKDDDG